jgi:hypothetical protein
MRWCRQAAPDGSVEPSEIARAYNVVVPRQDAIDSLAIRQCGLGSKVVALRAGSQRDDSSSDKEVTWHWQRAG